MITRRPRILNRCMRTFFLFQILLQKVIYTFNVVIPSHKFPLPFPSPFPFPSSLPFSLSTSPVLEFGRPSLYRPSLYRRPHPSSASDRPTDRPSVRSAGDLLPSP